MNTANVLPRVLLAALLACALFALAAASPAEAADANLWFKGKSVPLFIKNIQLLYAYAPRPNDDVVIMLQHSMSYEKHALSTVDSVRFLEILGERGSNPVFRVQLKMQNLGAPRDVILMPLRELRGTHEGRPWKLPVDYGRGYEDNAESLKEIKIVPSRESL